jgi:excisionase family DNA binding protein
MSSGKPIHSRVKLSRQFAAPSPMITATEVAVMVRAHVRTIYRLVRAGAIPHIRVGADVRFVREEIERWCKDREGQR